MMTQAWTEFVGKMDSGETIECEEETFEYFLEVLPPVFMSRNVSLPSGRTVKASFGFAEGAERIKAFWRENGRFYCCRIDVMNPYS